MITDIKIKNIATFDPENGTEIKGLNKINFIYGTNGTGKTTISNFLYDSSDLKFKNCSKQWKNDIEINTLVYNKKFKEEHFGKHKLNGVFTLGKATKDEIALIESKQEKLTELKNKHTKSKESLDAQIEIKKEKEEVFKEKVWKNIYKKNENNFKEAFKGAMNSKDNFKSKLLSEFTENTSAIKTIEELKSKSKTIFEERPISITPFNKIDYSKVLEIEKDLIWKKKIIGKTDVEIAKLIQKLNLSDWIIQGKTFIQEGDETCPFCQQKTISTDFKKQLESFFDENFTQDLRKVKDLKIEYITIASTIVNELNQYESQEKENKKTKLDISLFSANLKTFISQLSTNKEILQNKISEPSRSVEIVSVKNQLEKIEELLKTANDKIKEHNKIVDNFNIERINLINDIWKYLINENEDDIKTYNLEIDNLNKSIDGITKKYQENLNNYKELNKEIKELSLNITSVEPTVIEINNTLKTYGFLNFEIVPYEKEGNHYQIKREDGSLAESTLSEGEITFITFLYFLQIVKGSLQENSITEERILVIDDPVSSLDSSILFVVSTLIKNIIFNIKNGIGNVSQLILLTHNVYFHKEVSYTNNGNNKCNKTHFWILRKKNKISKIQPYIQENPIHTSYELLWRELKERKNNSLITIQNTMRRIIENYFKILGKYKDEDLIQKFETFEEQEICRSLMCWINDGSHSMNDDLFIEYQDETIEKYMKVFEEIFNITDHLQHYKMMMVETFDEESISEPNS